MVDEALVGDDIEAAANLIRFLDQHGMPVSGALWLYQSDAERWRFVVSFRERRANQSSFYLDVAKLVNAHREVRDLLDISRVDFVDPDRSVIGPLSKVIRIEGLSSVRFSHNRINGVYLEDAVIYRLAA